MPPKAPGAFVDDATRAWPLVGPANGAAGPAGAGAPASPGSGAPDAVAPHAPEPVGPPGTSGPGATSHGASSPGATPHGTSSPGATPPAVDLDQPFTLDEPVTMPFVPVQSRSPEPRSVTEPPSTPTGTTADTEPEAAAPDETFDTPDTAPATGRAPVTPPPLFHGGGPVPAESASGRTSAAVSPWAQPPQRPPGEQGARPTGSPGHARATGTARRPVPESGAAAGQAPVQGSHPVPPYHQQSGAPVVPPPTPPAQPGVARHGQGTQPGVPQYDQGSPPPPDPQPGGWGVPQPETHQPVGRHPAPPYPNGWAAPPQPAPTYPAPQQPGGWTPAQDPAAGQPVPYQQTGWATPASPVPPPVHQAPPAHQVPPPPPAPAPPPASPAEPATPAPAAESPTEPSGWTAQPAASWPGEGWRPAPPWQQAPPPVPPQHPGVVPVPQQPYQETPGVVRVPAAGQPDPAWPAEGPAPTAEDFARRRAARPVDPVATMGLRAAVNKTTLGLVKLAPGRQEQELKRDIDMVRRNFGGLRQVTVVNPKGGAGKTVAILLLAMTFGQKRGGYVLAWDNNETQGTLGMRAQQDFHSRTVRDMLRDLGQFQGAHGRVGDLSQYVRSQGEGMFDVLASDESATGGEMLTASAFAEIREVVSRFYKLIFVDTGNNVRAQNWQAAMDATDQLVITMSARNDSAETAARMLDHLEQSGRQRLVRQAVTVVSMPPSRKEIDLPAIQQHFAARTRAVLLAPYERLIDSGEPIRYGQLSAATRDAWLKIAAAVAEGL
ncbi:chromosome partitioning protein [Micromonospora sp. CPCC 206060]|uniref:MinD/ParA family ATP-binding protein n=1 Tax=Micromonospora sp. CPCC 206060 TaxID=3122406 RepID=UPI002FF3ABB8